MTSMALLATTTLAFIGPNVPPLGLRRARAAVALSAGPPPPPQKNAGFYQRPSAAVERGGGFYVPGLDSTALRLAVAVVLGGGLVLNRVLSPGSPVASQAFSELLGATGCALLIWQVLADEEAERQRESLARRAATVARLQELTEVSEALPALQAERGRWAAGALLRLTPACAVLWLGEDGVMLRYGRFDQPQLEEGQRGAQLMRELGGQPSRTWDDVGANVPELLPRASASLVLQSCGPGLIAVASERPGAFTSKHMAWIARVAQLLAPA